MYTNLLSCLYSQIHLTWSLASVSITTVEALTEILLGKPGANTTEVNIVVSVIIFFVSK